MAKRRRPSEFEAENFAPLTGPLDARSDPGDVAPNAFRHRLNMESPKRRSACRATGWQRLLSGNGDFHDQLLSLSDGAVTAPINFVFETRPRPGQSQLFVGTSHRLLKLNPTTRNFTVISDLFGVGLPADCSTRGWSGALTSETVVFSNSFDALGYHVLGQPNTETTQQALAPIPELATIGVTRAAFVVAWRGLTLLCNVVQDGVHVDHRVVWSDFRRPLSYVPKLNVSAASQKDLGQGDTLLAAAELGNSLLLYTTTGVWEVNIAALPAALTFVKRYSHPKGKACLEFPRTLISTGVDHIYGGRDDLYVYNLYQSEPQTPEWLAMATPLIYENVGKECNVHCAGYDSSSVVPQSQQQSGTVWFSWAREGEPCPTQSLKIQPDYHFVSLIDHGFTAFGQWTQDEPQTIRDWALNNCICSEAGLTEAGFGFVKEAPPCDGLNVPTCASYPQYIYTDKLKIVDGVEVEDWDQPSAHPDSLCAKLGLATPEDLCGAEATADQCNAPQLFLGASATDNCIKNFGDIYARQRCTNFTGCGGYVLDPYTTTLRSGPLAFGYPDLIKTINHFLADLYPEEQTVPSKIRLRIGSSYQPVDPNLPNCGVRWTPYLSLPLRCRTTAANLNKALEQGLGYEWPLHRRGNWLYWELSIEGTGGACCFSRVEMNIAVQGC